MEQMSRTADRVERTIAGDSRTAPVSAVKAPAWIKQALFGGTTGVWLLKIPNPVLWGVLVRDRRAYISCTDTMRGKEVRLATSCPASA
jgi:hypothetical protein